MRQTLVEMGCPQPPTPIQTYNITAEDVVNNTIVAKKMKSIDLRLRCREAQKQFRFYSDKGHNNWGDYHTKQHPTVYHELKRSLFSGCAQILLHFLRAQCKYTE